MRRRYELPRGQGIKASEFDRAGRTALHYATIDAPVGLDHGAALSDPALKAENHRTIVEFILDNSQSLLDAGADVNAHDEVGSTPLHFAAKGESEEVIRLLIDSGADVNATNNRGETPLNNAVGNTTPPCSPSCAFSANTAPTRQYRRAMDSPLLNTSNATESLSYVSYSPNYCKSRRSGG